MVRKTVSGYVVVIDGVIVGFAKTRAAALALIGV